MVGCALEPKMAVHCVTLSELEERKQKQLNGRFHNVAIMNVRCIAIDVRVYAFGTIEFTLQWFNG